MRTNRGTAIVEMAISITTLCVLVGGSLGVIYYAVASLWIQHSLHEALICLAQQEPAATCRDRLHDNLTRQLPFGEVQSIDLKHSGSWLNGAVLFKLSEEIAITERQKMPYPIVPSQFFEVAHD